MLQITERWITIDNPDKQETLGTIHNAEKNIAEDTIQKNKIMTNTVLTKKPGVTPGSGEG